MEINISKPMNQYEIKRLQIFTWIFLAGLLLICVGFLFILIAAVIGPAECAVTGLLVAGGGGLLALLVNLLTGVTFNDMDDISVLMPHHAAAMLHLFERHSELIHYRLAVLEQGRPFYMFELIGLEDALTEQKNSARNESNIRRLYNKVDELGVVS